MEVKCENMFLLESYTLLENFEKINTSTFKYNN